MSTYFAALSAAMAHQMSQPDPAASDTDWFCWWFDHAELLIDLADADDAGRDESCRARQLAHHAMGEAFNAIREPVA